MKKRASFPFFRSVKAQMEERYIFNFLIKPDDLAKKLPVPWLEPQTVEGWSVVSFCILWLKKLSVVPIPAIIPFETLSCAYRIGVIDTSGSAPEPSVYITERWADLALAAKLAPWTLLDSVPVIEAKLDHRGDSADVRMGYFDGSPLFVAKTKPSSSGFESEIFDSMDGFAKFIKDGVSSYASSLYAGTFTKVDLLKEDVEYKPLDAEVEYSELHKLWEGVDMKLDSTVRATGAQYKWTYRGLWCN